MKKHSSQTSGVVSREVVCLFWHELRLLCKRTVVYNVLRWGPAELNTLGVNFPPLLDRHLLVAETALSSTCVKRVVHHCCDYVGGVFYCQLPSLFVSFTDSKKKIWMQSPGWPALSKQKVSPASYKAKAWAQERRTTEKVPLFKAESSNVNLDELFSLSLSV